MRRFDFLANFLGQFREELPDHVVRCEAVRVVRFEVLLPNYAAVISVEKSWKRHPLGHALRFCIQDVEAANDLGIGISQQGKLDLVAFRKVREDSFTIVANGSQLDTLLLELCFGVLQLHELRFAEGSPVGGTEKKDDRPFGTF